MYFWSQLHMFRSKGRQKKYLFKKHKKTYLLGYLLSPNSEQALDLTEITLNNLARHLFLKNKNVKSVSVKNNIRLFFFSYQNRDGLNQLPLKTDNVSRRKKGGSKGLDSSPFCYY